MMMLKTIKSGYFWLKATFTWVSSQTGLPIKGLKVGLDLADFISKSTITKTDDKAVAYTRHIVRILDDGFSKYYAGDLKGAKALIKTLDKDKGLFKDISVKYSEKNGVSVSTGVNL
ncbi:MAG: hypothetical protein O2963_00200 [Proteobacteria bacterium]|nr:hypothetical protein [Pseudomonadota bacterium]